MTSNKSTSRDLLALETNGPPISPFLISPSTQAFPFNADSGAGGAAQRHPPASPAKVQLLSSSGNEPSNDGGYAAARAKFRSAHVGAPSALIARVAAFLPQLASANARLESELLVGGDAARQKVDIEHVEDEGKQHIEMNIDVGVLEMQKDSDLGDTPEIIIPGVSSSSLTAAAAAASSNSAGLAAQSVSSSDDDDHDDGDEDDAPHMGSNGNTHMRSALSSSISSPAQKSSSAASVLSRAARKKKKYRERTKEKGSAATAATAAMDTGETEQQQQQQQKRHPLIEEMED